MIHRMRSRLSPPEKELLRNELRHSSATAPPAPVHFV
eukprot:COSAG02_NODE_43262_length_376_cov_1.101083_1_plen_36_part_10